MAKCDRVGTLIGRTIEQQMPSETKGLRGMDSYSNSNQAFKKECSGMLFANGTRLWVTLIVIGSATLMFGCDDAGNKVRS